MMLPPDPLPTRDYESTLTCYCRCCEYLDGKINSHQLSERVKSSFNSDARWSPLLSAVGILESEQFFNNQSKPRAKGRTFTELLNALMEFVPLDDLKETLDFGSLASSQIIPSHENLNQKCVKLKTRMFYKQQKFNLFREESEGYSKLLTLLLQSTEASDASRLKHAICSLIGFFNLDPNRVFDVVLEAMECNISCCQLYIDVFRLFNVDKSLISHLLGFKINSRPDLKSNINTCRVAARLTAARLLNLEEFLGHLEISEETTRSTDNASANQLLAFITELVTGGQLSLSLTLLSCYPEIRRPCSYHPLALALCSSLDQCAYPLYRLCASLPELLQEDELKATDGRKVVNWHDFNVVLFPILKLLGPELYRSPATFIKLARISQFFLTHQDRNKPGDELLFYKNFKDSMVDVFLPALSLLEFNEPASLELWECLKHFHYRQRYRMYGVWNDQCYELCEELRAMKQQVLNRARYIIKRITKENIRNYSRQIAKLSHCNPVIVCQYIVDSIQRYDNFILPVVDALKYLSPLVYDVLIYCIVLSLADPTKEALKHDGVCFSGWMKSLTLFGSSILRKYSVELTGIIQHILDQLEAGRCFDLLFLQQILQKMCGIENVCETTEHQLECLSGGPTLRCEGGCYSVNRNIQKSLQRFKEHLYRNNFIVPLCVKIAQQRENFAFGENVEHSKLSGYLYDQCQNSLVQMMNFLSAALTLKEHADLFPSLLELVCDYGISVDIAFILTRPTHQYRIQELSKTRADGAESKSKEQRDYIVAYWNNLTVAIQKLPLGVFCGPRLLPSGEGTSADAGCSCPYFYVTFWTSSMYDLRCPTEAYERQRQHLKDLIIKAEEQKELDSHKLAREQEKFRNLIEQLYKEEREHKQHTEEFLRQLETSKDEWFPKDIKIRAEIITEFLNQCVYPRCVLSELDAVFCAKFINVVHKLKIPEFSTIICYDRIFMNITVMLASCTECEADRYGRFLVSLLETAMGWHADRQLYEKDCFNYPGFLTSFRYSLNASRPTPHKEERLTYENYRHVCHKWHYLLTLCFVGCLESVDYVQIRNSLKILIRLLPCYPRITGMYYALEKRIDKIRQTEKDSREDLYTLALGYLGQLRSKRQQMVEEYQFHDKTQQSSDSGQHNMSASQLPALGDSAKKVEAPHVSGNTSTPRNQQEKPKEESASHHAEKPKRSAESSHHNSQGESKRDATRSSVNGKSHNASSTPVATTEVAAPKASSRTDYKSSSSQRTTYSHSERNTEEKQRRTSRERKRPDHDLQDERRRKRAKEDERLSPVVPSADSSKKLSRSHDAKTPVSSSDHHYHGRQRTYQR